MARAFGKPLDLATVLAGAFLVSSVPHLLRSLGRVAHGAFLGLAALAPLGAVLAPAVPGFSIRQFAVSYAHWLFVACFFVAGSTLPATGLDRRMLARANWIMGGLVALFGVYQAIGIPRGWPGTGPVLISGQREPFRFTWIGGTYLGGGYTRPTSVFLEPAWMGGYLCWAFALAVGLVAARGIPRERGGVATAIVRVVGLTVIPLAILATVSWGAYLDLAAVSTGLFVTSWSRRRSGLLRAVLLLPVALTLLLLITTPGSVVRRAISQRWEMLRETPTSAEASSAARDSSWVRAQNLRYSARMFSEHALTGIGLGQFGRSESVAGADGLARFRDPWCGWLAVAAEMGVLGPFLLGFAILLAGLKPAPNSTLGFLAPVLALLAIVQQAHTGSYIDLWWWYPLTTAALLKSPPRGDSNLVEASD